ACMSQPVVLRPLSLFRGLPFRCEPPLLFQPMESGIERAGLYLQKFFGFRANCLRDSEAVARPPLQDLQDEHVERSLKNVDAVFTCFDCHRYRDSTSFVIECL